MHMVKAEIRKLKKQLRRTKDVEEIFALEGEIAFLEDFANWSEDDVAMVFLPGGKV